MGIYGSNKIYIYMYNIFLYYIYINIYIYMDINMRKLDFCLFGSSRWTPHPCSGIRLVVALRMRRVSTPKQAKSVKSA